MVGFMYLNTFATEVLLIPAETLAVALLVAKTIDFFVSMFAGLIIEKLKISSKRQEPVLAVPGPVDSGNHHFAGSVQHHLRTYGGSDCGSVRILHPFLNCLMNVIQTAYYGVLGSGCRTPTPPTGTP